MKCPMKFVRQFLQGADLNTDYARYLTLAAVLSSSEKQLTDEAKSDRLLFSAVYQCIGLWVEQIRANTSDLVQVKRYDAIIIELTNLLSLIPAADIATIRSVVHRETEMKILVSLLKARDLYPGEQLFLAAHWTSEVLFRQAVIDLMIATELLKSGDISNSAVQGERVPAYIKAAISMLKIMDDFLSREDFMKLRKDKLGQGVGSPGVEGTKTCARRFDKAFEEHLEARGISKERLALLYYENLAENNPLWQITSLLEELNQGLKDWGLAHAELAEHKLPPGYTGVSGMTIETLRERAKVSVLMRTWLSFKAAKKTILRFIRDEGSAA